jgi:hypothetical protein
MGTWERLGPGRIRVGFQKLLIDGGGTHLGDFHGRGRPRLEGSQLLAEWERIWIEAMKGATFELGTATSEGTRIE